MLIVRWSRKTTPSRLARSFSSFVAAMSALPGVKSPEGWLCATTISSAPAFSASRKIASDSIAAVPSLSPTDAKPVWREPFRSRRAAARKRARRSALSASPHGKTQRFCAIAQGEGRFPSYLHPKRKLSTKNTPPRKTPLGKAGNPHEHHPKKSVGRFASSRNEISTAKRFPQVARRSHSAVIEIALKLQPFTELYTL